MVKGTIRKTGVTDYVNFRTHKINTGKAFEIVLENGLEIWLPQSWTKKQIVDYVQSQVGGVELTELAA